MDSPNGSERDFRFLLKFGRVMAIVLAFTGAPDQLRARGNLPTYQYVIDGLALGDPVAPASSAYREYRCRPSEQFASFIWCQRDRKENGKFGAFSSVTSILHSQDNTAVYISRHVEPAYFAPGDVEREIRRLSQLYGAQPHILQTPQWLKGQQGLIAYWGAVTLEPLDAESLAQLASGQSVRKGLLFDFLGNFGQSANENLPVFHLGGGAGYVWGAHFDGNGIGALRMTAIDATQFTPPSYIAHNPPAVEGRSAGVPRVTLSSGSGFFVSKNGMVLTNNHVIDDCASIRVFMDSSEAAEARTIARDTTNDLALLSTTLKPPGVAAPRFTLRLGKSVAAFGYPHADILSTSGNFTQGNVTALAGMGDDTRYVQMSAPVQAGNSGGPLLDQNGNLVGVVTAKLNAVKIFHDSGDLPQNVNFALKASLVANFLDSKRIKYSMGIATSALKPEDLADLARSMSVFILCK